MSVRGDVAARRLRFSARGFGMVVDVAGGGKGHRSWGKTRSKSEIGARGLEGGVGRI